MEIAEPANLVAEPALLLNDDRAENDNSAEGRSIHLPRVAARCSDAGEGWSVAESVRRRATEGRQSELGGRERAVVEANEVRSVELSSPDQEWPSVTRRDNPKHLVPAPLTRIPELRRLNGVPAPARGVGVVRAECRPSTVARPFKHTLGDSRSAGLAPLRLAITVLQEKAASRRTGSAASARAPGRRGTRRRRP